MRLYNHIAYRYLQDPKFIEEMIEASFTREEITATEPNPKIASFWYDNNKDGNVTYYVTETVLDKLKLLRVKKRSVAGEPEHYDWTVFNTIRNCKKTFILPDNHLLRLVVSDKFLYFNNVAFNIEDKKTTRGEALWVMFYVDRHTGEECEHFASGDVKSIEEFIYKLLCFFFLSENEEIILEPGRKQGTQKSGKIINDLQTPIIIVNSKWNITSIRTEGFTVGAHFAVRWTGPERKVARMVWIEPYEKHGYKRVAKKIEE